VFIITLPISIFLGSTLLRATGDLNQMIVANVVSLLVTVGTLVLLVDRIGVNAAAWSVVAGSIALTAVATVRILERQQIAFHEYLEWRRIFFVSLAAFGSALAGFYLTWLMPQWLRVFVGPGIAGVTYLSVVWFVGLLPETERRWIGTMWSRAQGYFSRA
jgi:hypothetical protein